MSKGRVLIVEDKPNWQRMLERELTNAGYEVIGKANCEKDALRLFQEHTPDVVTMDGMLLYGDLGENVARAIRQLSKATAIVMLSASGDTFEGRGVTKSEPRQIENLMALIAEALEAGRQLAAETRADTTP